MKVLGKWTVSLRLIISIIIIIVSVVPAAVVSEVLISTAISSEIETTSSEIQGQVLILANQLQSDGYMSHYSTSGMSDVVQQIADIWGCRIQVINTSGRIIFDSYNVDKGRYNISEFVLQALNGETVTSYDSSDKLFAVAMPVQTSEDSIAITDINSEDLTSIIVDGAILVNIDMQQRVTGLSGLRSRSVQLWLVFLCFAMLIVVLMLVYIFRPYRNLIKQLERAYEGSDDIISIGTYSETARLSESMNRTIKKIHDLDESRREFVSNVSHELKTPITSIRVLADSLNSMGQAPVELYQEFMQDISRELERESNTIDDLLSMVRLEEGANPLNITEVDMNVWLENMMKSIAPISAKAGIELSLESIRPVIASFDEPKMYRAISNLITNAIKYNKPNGWVKVTLDADYHYFIVKVEDGGIGIPEEAFSHIFERFYRVDKARSRESGGTGLGLAIAKKIFNMHKGSLKFTSQVGVGTTFVAKAPLEYRPQDEKEGEDEENMD